jgi:hypothetical protein
MFLYLNDKISKKLLPEVRLLESYFLAVFTEALYQQRDPTFLHHHCVLELIRGLEQVRAS